MGNSPGEAESWAEAARLYLKAESVYRKARLPSYEGCIDAAVHCFLLAIHVSTLGWEVAAICVAPAGCVLNSVQQEVVIVGCGEHC